MIKPSQISLDLVQCTTECENVLFFCLQHEHTGKPIYEKT